MVGRGSVADLIAEMLIPPVIQYSSNGERIVQTRNSVDGMLDQSFSQASALPRNINTVIPGPNGGAWVMAGDVSDPFIFGLMSPMLEQQVILIDSVGNRKTAWQYLALMA